MKLRNWGLIVKVGRGPATVYVFNHRLCGGLANRGYSTSRVDRLGSNDDSNILVKGLRRIYRLADNGFDRDRVGFKGLVRVWFTLCLYRERGRAVDTRELAVRLGYSLRYVQRCLARLVEGGLVVPTGSRRCGFVAYIPVCLPQGIFYAHRHVRDHRYRRRCSRRFGVGIVHAFHVENSCRVVILRYLTDYFQ